MKAILTIGTLTAMLVACVSPAVTSPNSASQIDAYLGELSAAGEFSGAALVARQGQILLSKGYGLADVDKQAPNTPQTRYRIHWVSMQFTAMGILMLQAQGELDVQDPICRYVPDCPDYWQEITIHHLLTHTSGLSDWIQPWDSEAGRPANSLQLVEQLTHKPPYFAPGEGFRYSENSYIILGYIIEKVSGESYETYLKQHIFEPLGMRNTGLETDPNTLAAGYKSLSEAAPIPDLLFRYSASGLYSSVEDLYLWDQALYGEQLLAREYLEMIFTGYARTPSMDIQDAYYGYGWFVGKVLDRLVVAHGGIMAGYSAMLLRFPDERVTIIMLRNCCEMQLYDRLEIELAKMVFDE